MKGTISKQLEAILRDPRGREQLREHLLHGKDGRIQTADKCYVFRAGVHHDGKVPGKDAQR